MTEREIIDCVRLWQRRLLLEGWEIEVNLEDPPESGDHALAECRRETDYLAAEIRFAVNWSEWTRDRCQLPAHSANATPRSLDRMVVHELLHLATHDLYNAGRVEVGLLTRDVDRLHEAELDHQLERHVEHLARILVDAFAPAPSLGGILAEARAAS